ncbi:hypothetical protein ACIRYZ_42915 [Kitasatospora sp. NPDC101155]|uniref:LppU/SCO3897 family protein n=1 Tax=Kitasatospora sp. NPDC101155 TaxID=3364097 RepID=UPI00381FE2C3
MTTPPAQSKPTGPGQQPKLWEGCGCLLTLILSGLLVVGLVVAAFAFGWFSGAPASAKVGDCVQNKGTDRDPDVRVLACSDPNAQYKVLKSEPYGKPIACFGVPGVVANYYETGTEHVLLCLGENG